MARGPRDLLRRLGVDVARYPLHSTVSGHVRWVLNKLDVTTVLDVGANEGQFGRRLREECRFKGTIVSFEPFPTARRALEGLARRDPEWTCLPFALGDRREQLELQTFDGSDWNSLHTPDQRNVAAAGRTLQATGSVPVDVRRLDDVWPDIVGSDDVTFLKTDTQGHDLQVLAGAGACLQSVVGLLIETSVLPFYEGEPRLADAITAVTELGFEPTGFFPVARRKNSIALTTVDVCFVQGRG